MKTARSPGLAGFLAEAIRAPAALRPVKSAALRKAQRNFYEQVYDPKNFKASNSE